VRALSERGAAALDEPVRVAMTSDVTTCQPGDTIPAIMEVMTLSKFRHLPVVDEGRLVGIISIGDAVKHRLMEFENEQTALRDYIKTA
jgi:CBS domain-containing protein